MEHGFYDQQLASGFKEGGYLSEKSLCIRHLMDHIESQGKINFVSNANPILAALMGEYPGFQASFCRFISQYLQHFILDIYCYDFSILSSIFAIAMVNVPDPHPKSRTVCPRSMYLPRIFFGLCMRRRIGLSIIGASHHGQIYNKSVISLFSVVPNFF